VKRGRKPGSHLRSCIKLRMKRHCPDGHPYDAGNTRVQQSRYWLKREQRWTTYTTRHCRACQTTFRLLDDRRRRAAGKKLNYAQWAARKGTHA